MGAMKDTPLSFQTLVGIHPSTQMTSSMCGRRVGIFLSLLRRTCSVLLSCHLDSIPPYCSYFLRIDLDTSLGNHESQELSHSNHKRTFTRV